MKKTLILVLLIIIAIATTSFTLKTIIDAENATITYNDDYCDGWEDGYCEGWKDVKGINALCPLTPLCPLPEINKSEYRDGYNRGFKAGRRKASK